MATEQKEQSLRLVLYPNELTVYRLDKGTKIPQEILDLKWFTISKTLEELSIIVPSNCDVLKGFPEMKQEREWRCMKIDSVLDFGLVGILASIVNPLKEVGIPVFVVSTFDTDYILVNKCHVENAKKVIMEKTSYDVTNSDLSLC